MSSTTAADSIVVPRSLFKIPSSTSIIALTGTYVTDKSNPMNLPSFDSKSFLVFILRTDSIANISAFDGVNRGMAPDL